MNLLVVFLVGCVVGWLTQTVAIKFGSHLMGEDEMARKRILDGLSFTALVKLRDAASGEIEKRKGTTST